MNEDRPISTATDLASSHWVHSLCLDYFVCVRLCSCIISACILYYCNTVRWAWLDWGLSGWLTTLLLCFDTVGRVIRPVKAVGRISYIVLVQTLNHAQTNRVVTHWMFFSALCSMRWCAVDFFTRGLRTCTVVAHLPCCY